MGGVQGQQGCAIGSVAMWSSRKQVAMAPASDGCSQAWASLGGHWWLGCGCVSQWRQE